MCSAGGETDFTVEVLATVFQQTVEVRKEEVPIGETPNSWVGVEGERACHARDQAPKKERT